MNQRQSGNVAATFLLCQSFIYIFQKSQIWFSSSTIYGIFDGAKTKRILTRYLQMKQRQSGSFSSTFLFVLLVPNVTLLKYDADVFCGPCLQVQCCRHRPVVANDNLTLNCKSCWLGISQYFWRKTKLDPRHFQNKLYEVQMDNHSSLNTMI